MTTNDEYKRSTLNDRVLLVMNDLKQRFDQDNLSFDYNFEPDKYVALHTLVGYGAIIINNEVRIGLNYSCNIFINQPQFQNIRVLCKNDIYEQSLYTIPQNRKKLQINLNGIIKKKPIKGKKLVLLRSLNTFELIEIKLLESLTKSKDINHLVYDTNQYLKGSGFYIKAVRSYTHENSYVLRFSTTR